MQLQDVWRHQYCSLQHPQMLPQSLSSARSLRKMSSQTLNIQKQQLSKRIFFMVFLIKGFVYVLNLMPDCIRIHSASLQLPELSDSNWIPVDIWWSQGSLDCPIPCRSSQQPQQVQWWSWNPNGFLESGNSLKQLFYALPDIFASGILPAKLLSQSLLWWV